MKDKEHFELLKEVDLFVTDQSFFIFCRFPDPDENEERHAGVKIEDLLSGIDLKRNHDL